MMDRGSDLEMPNYVKFSSLRAKKLLKIPQHWELSNLRMILKRYLREWTRGCVICDATKPNTLNI